MLPHTPAPKDAAKVPIFDMASCVPSPKARFAMNNDMVKPIPQIQLAPKIWPHERSEGRCARRVFADNQATKHIPRGLPMNNPRAAPRVAGGWIAHPPLPWDRTPALSKA